jgi:hypothetical protein
MFYVSTERFFRRANQTDLFQMNITNYDVNYRLSFSLFHTTLAHSASANQLGSFFSDFGENRRRRASKFRSQQCEHSIRLVGFPGSGARTSNLPAHLGL